MQTILNTNISVDEFYQNYWHKKPLFIKGAVKSTEDLLLSEDICDLAQDENATARLLARSENYLDKWLVKQGPFQQSELEHLPPYAVVLLQNLEGWSPEIGELWNSLFGFIPSWLRDDIMGFYTTQNGTVGKHYDEYDVFLLQISGHQRWQLGKQCDEHTEYLTNQPIRIFTDMGELIFDEVMEPGDILYIPTNVAHYGVGLNDGVTLSFGLRSFNMEEVLLNLLRSTASSDNSMFTRPLEIPVDIVKQQDLNQTMVNYLKELFIKHFTENNFNSFLQDTILRTVTDRRYDVLPYESVNYTAGLLLNDFTDGAILTLDTNQKLACFQNTDDTVTIYLNGEHKEFSELCNKLLSRLVVQDLAFADISKLLEDYPQTTVLEEICSLINTGILYLK